ncbi:MAG: TraB/GumN family protein [Desulfobulbaceae bacterium]|nr:TraB/GumN family protein [Desulfobulbaceae bacterium]
MTSSLLPFPTQQYGEDVRIVQAQNKTILLVGTAHLSQLSLQLVEQVITCEQPDTVCIELDYRRYQALSRKQSWENLDLKQLIRNKQLSTLLATLVLASYQKRLGGQTGMTPGAELLKAAQTAEALDIPVVLCDRDIRITLRRAWRNTPWHKKGYLLAVLIASLFEKTELDEEKLAAMRKQDVLAELMEELGSSLPNTKKALIDERDLYMAEQIRQADGERIVAVVGAGHLEGISRLIRSDNSMAIEEITTVPPVSDLWKALAWLIPLVIVLSLVAIGFRHGAEQFNTNALYWVLINGIPSALGSVLAGAHPVTVATAFFGAPFTSLTPLIGVGYVCAFVQVLMCPPIVREFEQIQHDISSFSGWWRNRLLRIFLIFLFSSLGSSLGTFLGGYRIISTLVS